MSPDGAEFSAVARGRFRDVVRTYEPPTHDAYTDEDGVGCRSYGISGCSRAFHGIRQT
jgi:hypothetical protein